MNLNKIKRFYVISIFYVISLASIGFIFYITKLYNIVIMQLTLFGIGVVGSIIYYIYVFIHLLDIKKKEPKVTYQSFLVLPILAGISYVIILIVYSIVLNE